MVFTSFLLVFVLMDADFSCLRSMVARGKLNLHQFIKCDAPAQTQNPGTGKETAEIFP